MSDVAILFHPRRCAALLRAGMCEVYRISIHILRLRIANSPTTIVVSRALYKTQIMRSRSRASLPREDRSPSIARESKPVAGPGSSLSLLASPGTIKLFADLLTGTEKIKGGFPCKLDTRATRQNFYRFDAQCTRQKIHVSQSFYTG